MGKIKESTVIEIECPHCGEMLVMNESGDVTALKRKPATVPPATPSPVPVVPVKKEEETLLKKLFKKPESGASSTSGDSTPITDTGE